MFHEETSKKKTRPFLLVILLIKDSLQPQTHFNGNIFKNKCCRCNEGSLYKVCSVVITTKLPILIKVYSRMYRHVWLDNVKFSNGILCDIPSEIRRHQYWYVINPNLPNGCRYAGHNQELYEDEACQ